MLKQGRTQAEKLARLSKAARRGGRAAALAAARLVNDPSREVRLRAFDLLCEAGDRRSAALALAALDDAEDTVAVTALECLVNWEVRRSVDKIVPLLGSESELTRAYAAWAIGKLGGDRHVALLRKRLNRLTDEVEGSALAEALFMLTGERRYLRHLISQLKSRDPEARAFTTNSLVGVADEKNFASIICALAEALSSEKSKAVLPSISRDLAEVVSLAVQWKVPAQQ